MEDQTNNRHSEFESSKPARGDGSGIDIGELNLRRCTGAVDRDGALTGAKVWGRTICRYGFGGCRESLITNQTVSRTSYMLDPEFVI